MLLTEKFNYTVGKLRTKFGIRDAAYIKTDSQDTRPVKEILKKYKAWWNSQEGCWYWDLSKNGEWVLQNYVKPCIEELKSAEMEHDGNGEERDAIATVNELINLLKNGSVAPAEDNNTMTKDEMLDKLEGFKRELVQITSDEEFKSRMAPIIKFRNAHNYEYSLLNTILIMIQDPKATLVKPRGAWEKYYQRQVKPGAPAIMLRMPKGKRAYNDEERKEVISKFLAKKGVKTIKDLSAPDRERLDKQLAKTKPLRYDFEPNWYDYRYTTGSDEIIGNPGDDIKWYDDSGEETPELVRHINALIEVIKERGIQFNFVDDIGGARGVSKSGVIDVLGNQPRNAGMFNTITHEFAHELLHQKYLQTKDDEMKGYFVGTSEGRGKVEQQAELCAWIVLRSFGIDMPTNINYVGIWGLNQDNAVKVFDSVSTVATFISQEIMKKEKGETSNMYESKKYIKENNIPSGEEIAQMVGCGDVYRKAKKRQGFDSDVIRMSQDELTEIVKSTVNSMISEGLLDNMKSNFGKIKHGFNKFANGFDYKEGNPTSIEDLFEGDGWRVISVVPKNGGTYYFVSRMTGSLGAFHGQETEEMVEELNMFLRGNKAKYIGKYKEKPYIEIFRIAK